MAVQDEVTWLIAVIQDNWPGVEFPSNLALRDKDESRTFYPDGTDRVEQSVNADSYATVGVAHGNRTQQFYGNKPQYDVETTVDVEVEAKSDREWGESEDKIWFNTVATYTQNAINTQIQYPQVDTGDENIGRVTYLDLAIQDVDYRSREFKDMFRRDFTVRLRGRQDTP